MQTKTCAGCRHWKRTPATTLGQCSAPIPVSVRTPRFMIRIGPTAEDAGSKCPAWRKKIERARKGGPVIPQPEN